MVDRVERAIDLSTGQVIDDLRTYLRGTSPASVQAGGEIAGSAIENPLRVKISAADPGPIRQPSSERPPSEVAAIGDRCWIPPGRDVAVAGYDLRGGMLYVGKSLPSIGGWQGSEPALIDPTLPVARRSPSHTGDGMSYWPSYGNIPAECRAGYLEWLAGGRTNPHAYIGYVFLFLYGLERRLLFDLRHLSERKREARELTDEVERLLSIYGENRSFRRYASSLLQIARLLWAEGAVFERPPSLEPAGGDLPIDVRVALGHLVAAGEPLSAEWAFAWVAGHPETRLRTPSRRCPEEFKQLFRIRFAEKFGAGMSLKPNKRRLCISHTPASASFGGPVNISLDLPDVSGLSGPLRVLREMAETASSELESYSRFIGRNPQKSGSLQALALLPPELAATRESAETTRLRGWVDQALIDREYAVAGVSELMSHWPCECKDRIRKDELGSLARMLHSIGYGVEPDPRFGGGALPAEQKIVLFRLPAKPNSAVSSTYRAATLLLQLAAAVASSDGKITADEERHMEEHLERAMDFTEAEIRRLRAHLQWLLASQPPLTGLKRRIEEIDANGRQQLAQFALAIALADGVIDPGEVRTLSKIYHLLGLDPERAYGDIHSLRTSSGWIPTDRPVTVRPAEGLPAGYAIPGRPDRSRASETGFRLNVERIERTLAETAVVSKVLAGVFIEEEFSAASSQKATASTGLDPSHTRLLLALKDRPELPREEFEKLAEEANLLPGGAYEALNEAAFDRVDRPLLEGENPIHVDLQTLGALTE